MNQQALDTLELAERTIAIFKRPALMVSFGKDSMAMLHLLRHLNLDVICHRPPFDARKWEFAEEIARRWNLRVFDWAPRGMALQRRGDGIELVSFYNLGNSGDNFALGQKIEHTDQGDARSLICGLNDCLRRPMGAINHVWDMVIVAQKNGDNSHDLGVPLKVEGPLKQSFSSPMIYCPFWNWADDDVWRYLIEEKVPVAPAYIKGEKRSVDDPDVVRGCFACVTSDQKTVPCPKMFGQPIKVITDQILHIEAREEF